MKSELKIASGVAAQWQAERARLRKRPVLASEARSLGSKLVEVSSELVDSGAAAGYYPAKPLGELAAQVDETVEMI